MANLFLFQWITLIKELSDKNFFKLNKFIHFLVPIYMGHCTSDPLGYLTNSYGDDVCKYIVSIKSI